MRIKINNRISNDKADSLIEKYYEGLTTGDEERQLKAFLSRRDLPDKYKPEQAILGYFDRKAPKKHVSLLPYIRWASVAAVVVLGLFSIQRFTADNKANYAFIDGHKVSNMHTIKSQALASLVDVSSSTNEVEEGFKSLNENESIEQQLDVFSSTEK